MDKNNQIKSMNFFKKEMEQFNRTKDQKLKKFIKKLHLENLCPENQIIKLHAELQTLKESQDDWNNKEYLLFSDNQKQLFNIFNSRVMSGKPNEIELIKKSILLVEKHKSLKKLFRQVQEIIPPFTYSHYLSHTYNIIFFRLHQCPLNTSREDYLKIKETQSLRILTAIQEEVHHLKISFLMHSHNPTREAIQKEIENTENLPQLLALRNSGIPNNLKPYTRKPLKEETLETPLEQIDKIIYDYSNSANPGISAPQIFYHSLQKYKVWLNQILINCSYKPETNSEKMYNYNEIFNQTLKRAQQAARKEIREMKKSVSRKQITVVKETLKNLQNMAKRKEIPILDYTKKNKEKARTIFFNHLIFTHNDTLSIIKLFYSIKISILVDYHIRQLNNLYKRFEITDDFPTYTQIIYLLTCMIPDSPTYNRLLKIITTNTKYLKHNDKPLYFIEDDIKTQLIDLYNTTAENLEEKYYNLDDNISACHAIRQKRNLERLECRNHRNNIESCPQLKNLKMIFQAEADLVDKRDIAKDNFDIDKILYPVRKKRRKKQVLSFGYKYNDSAKLLNALKTVNAHIQLLKPANSCKQLTDLLTAKRISPGKEKIYLNCSNKMFRFIILTLKPYFKTLTYKNLGESKMFYSHNNTLLTAKNIGNANLDNIPERQTIIKIINEIMP